MQLATGGNFKHKLIENYTVISYNPSTWTQ